MKKEEKIEKKFNQLLQEGNDILNRSGWNGEKYYKFPSTKDYLRWRTEALNLIKIVCGQNSVHYKQLKQLAEDEDSRNNSYYFVNCFGILEAAGKDYADGFIDVEGFIQAELFEDFLSMAEYLLNEGYYVPAASLAGAVLEDSLRKICDRKNLVYRDKTNINSLNTILTKVGVYTSLVQKEITAKADIRNNADHGHYDKFKKEDVEDMIKWVRRFIIDYL